MSAENPQLEDGYTPIANPIMEALARTPLTGYEERVVWFLLRKTYGWSKKTDHIALSQFTDETGIPERRVIEAINGLISKNIIHKTSAEKRTSKGREYEFNKHFGTWQLLRKSAVRKTADAENRTSLLRKTADTISIQDTTKEIKILSTSELLSKSVPVDRGEESPAGPAKKSFTPKQLAAQEVLAYLNAKAGTHYKTTQLIPARLAEGHTVEECKTVIDKKCAEWLGTPFAKHLDPTTLFRPANFDRYLNQPDAGPKPVTLADFWKHPIGLQSQWQDQPEPDNSRIFNSTPDTPEEDAEWARIEAQIEADNEAAEQRRKRRVTR